MKNCQLNHEMKAALLDHFRLQLGAELTCTELWSGYGIADFIALSKKGEVIEVEIKINKMDLKHELSKGLKQEDINSKSILIRKHDKNRLEDSFCANHYCRTPNKFYFCVPQNILDFTLEFAEKLNSKYGVILYTPSKYRKHRLKIKRRGRKLHDVAVSEYYRKRMINRICNDLCAMYRRMYL